MSHPRIPTSADRTIRFTKHIWTQSRKRFPYCAALTRHGLRDLLQWAALYVPRYAEHAVIGKSYLRFLLPDGQPMTLVVADSHAGARICRSIVTALTDEQVPAYCAGMR